jgi:hypothetical protein
MHGQIDWLHGDGSPSGRFERVRPNSSSLCAEPLVFVVRSSAWRKFFAVCVPRTEMRIDFVAVGLRVSTRSD